MAKRHSTRHKPLNAMRALDMVVQLELVKREILPQRNYRIDNAVDGLLEHVRWSLSASTRRAKR